MSNNTRRIPGPDMTRRETGLSLLGLLAVAGFGTPAFAAATQRLGPATPFSWEAQVAHAQALAGKPYAAPTSSAKAFHGFDAAGRATYGAADTVADHVRLLPTTDIAPHPVAINVVRDGKARPLADFAGLFAGGADGEPAGFRVLDENGRTDWLAYLGASYFRSAGARGQYGLSARAVAVDTGLDAEEFPAFSEFWIEPLGPRSARIHALLDGPSVTGAFAFDSELGDAGVVQQVRGALFARRDIRRLGLAPATSMFWYDQASRTANDDWRPEIHDSDGLAIHMHDGERIWRPLDNPRDARITTFRADDPRGFGLLQRDQDFAHYQDDGAFYDRRPSLWVAPEGDWGAGAVMLYEMPTDSETMDNIAAFWVADAPMRAGARRDVAYRLTWNSAEPDAGAIARCVDIFTGPGGIPGAPPIADARKLVFDFAGPSLAGLTRDSGVEAVTNLPAAALLASAAYPVVGRPDYWRVTLDIRTGALTAPELRLYLRRGDAALSETVIRMIDA